MTQTEALKLALDALCTCGPQQKQAIAAIKEALANHIPDATKMVAQSEQEPTNIERHERNVQKFLSTQQPKEPEQEPVAKDWRKEPWEFGEKRLVIAQENTPPPQRKPLTLEQLREHWQVAKVLDMTDAEIDFADYVLITRDVEALHGIKE